MNSSWYDYFLKRLSIFGSKRSLLNAGFFYWLLSLSLNKASCILFKISFISLIICSSSYKLWLSFLRVCFGKLFWIYSIWFWSWEFYLFTCFLSLSIACLNIKKNKLTFQICFDISFFLNILSMNAISNIFSSIQWTHVLCLQQTILLKHLKLPIYLFNRHILKFLFIINLLISFSFYYFFIAMIIFIIWMPMMLFFVFIFFLLLLFLFYMVIIV